LETVIILPSTIQFAGIDGSFAETHLSRFLPSNRIIASEGGSVFVLPGVTTGGTGVYTSVSFGSPWALAIRLPFRIKQIPRKSILVDRMQAERIIINGIEVGE
jgi:hypothetical protein